MWNLFKIHLTVVVLCYVQSLTVAEAIRCSQEDLEYTPGKWSRFCVFRGVNWRKGTPEPDFQESPELLVAFENSNLTAIPESFYNRFPELEFLVINNANLEKLKIKNKLRIVYAERNHIEKVEVEGGQLMVELYLKENPISDIGNITKLRNLGTLDLSATSFAESNDNTIDFKTFAGMDSLKELILSNLEAHYVENENKVTLPQLKLLDLSMNPIIPSNFHLHIFRGMPNLEELSLRDAMMSDLTATDIRGDLPALKRINIEGNSFSCSSLKPLLEHLKESNIDVMTSTTTNSKKCSLGNDMINGLCCKSDGHYFPDPESTPATKRTTTASTPTLTEGGADSTSHSTEDGSSLTIILLCIAAAVMLVALVVIIIYLKRRSRGVHNALPANDPHDNL